MRDAFNCDRTTQNFYTSAFISPSSSGNMKRFKRLKSTRRFVERSEARVHRLAASCTLAIRDLNEDRISDAEQQVIRNELSNAESTLKVALAVMGQSKKRSARANSALPLIPRPVPGDPTRLEVPGLRQAFIDSQP
jgi:hypothetical protein